MTVQALAPSPLHDNRHPDWCNPTECEPGGRFELDGRTFSFESLHVRTVAAFDALHQDLDDRTFPVKLVREMLGDDDHYTLYIATAAVRLTAAQLDMLRVTP